MKCVRKIGYWELALRYSPGKLQLTGITPEELFEESQHAGFQTLGISGNDLISSYRLPAIKSHKDPFDRVLVWQRIRNNLMLITADKKVAAYRQVGLKVV